jgi:hypothetical protein
LIDLKTSKRFEKKNNNGFRMWIVDDLSYDSIAKKGRKEGQALAQRW